MQLLTIDTPWKKEIKLGKEVINYLKKNKIKSIALFASIQFLNLNTVKKQLNSLNIKIKTTKAKRTSKEVQILGCDSYHDSFNKNVIKDSDLIMYIGDGLFHPKALLLAQIQNKKIREVLIWDPVSEKMKIISKTHIISQIKKLKANLKKYLLSNTIGILVTVKPGQQYLKIALKLKQELNKKGKKAYIFIDNTLPLNELDSFPFIESWVNTACPRIGLDDITHIKQPLINIREALNPEQLLEKLHKF
jgi:2-(3-amino-3-carboxypropyl)histidine synthase